MANDPVTDFRVALQGTLSLLEDGAPTKLVGEDSTLISVDALTDQAVSTIGYVYLSESATGAQNAALVQAALAATDSVRLVGSGLFQMGQVTLTSNKSIDGSSGTQLCPSANNNIFSANGSENIRISGLRISDVDGNPLSTSPYIRIQNSTGIEICGNVFTNHAGDAVRLNNVSEVRIERNTYKNGYANDVSLGVSSDLYMEGSFSDVIVAGNRHYARTSILNAKNIAIFAAHSTGENTGWTDVRVVDNFCTGYRRGGIYITEENPLTIFRSGRCVISQNIIRNSGQHAIKTKNTWYCVVGENIIDGFELLKKEQPNSGISGGIYINASQGSVVSSNHILGRNTKFYSGTIISGGTSTVTLPAGIGAAGNDEIAFMDIFLTGGAGAGQSARIASYNRTTGVTTVSPAFSIAADATTTFDIFTAPAQGVRVAQYYLDDLASITPRGREPTTVANNVIEDCRFGVTAYVENVLISGNTCFGVSGGIELEPVAVRGNGFHTAVLGNLLIGGGAYSTKSPGITVTNGTAIKLANNTIESFGTVGVLLSATTDVDVSDNKILNNGGSPGAGNYGVNINNCNGVRIVGNEIGNLTGIVTQEYGLRFGGTNTDICVIGNRLMRNNLGAVLSPPANDIYVNDNQGWDYEIALANSATPSVKNGTKFGTSGTTSITNFADGYDGQEIEVRRGSADTTVVYGGSTIRLANQVDVVLSRTAGAHCITLRRVSGVWMEIARATV